MIVVLRTSDHGALGDFERRLAELGAVVFDVPWLPAEDGGRYPDVLSEPNCAVGYARDHAREHGGDPDTLTVLSHSAGAYVAGLVAFAVWPGSCASLAALPARYVGIAGIYDLALGRDGRDDPRQREEAIAAYLEQDPDARPADAADLELANHLGENPGLRLLLVHGAIDPVVTALHSERWHQRLSEAGYASELRIVSDADHDSMLLDEEQASALAREIIDFARSAAEKGG